MKKLLKPYFCGASGRRYYFKDIGLEIQRDYPELIGAHIFEQLRALSLAHEFDFGCTTFALPFSFSIEKTP
jgi:hypothetical protein